MSFDVGRPDRATVSQLNPRPRSAAPAQDTGGFAQVYDLAKVRRGAPEVPMSVWDEVDRAAAIAADLEAAGRTIRFTEPAEGGRVRAELFARAAQDLEPAHAGAARVLERLGR